MSIIDKVMNIDHVQTDALFVAGLCQQNRSPCLLAYLLLESDEKNRKRIYVTHMKIFINNDQ